MRFYTIRESLLCDDDENQSEQSEQSEHCVLDRAEQCCESEQARNKEGLIRACI